MQNVQPTEVPAGAQLIDVRENDEWATVHAEGATHIPMSEITGRIQEIDPDRDIYVICHLGGRSAQVCQYLENSLGWDVINVEGGTDKWEADDLPVVRD
ncbi:rhodanese-like domain-containing protein [Corynebacterium sp. ACRQM]|jgi:rhodanese domain sulfurtransferase|uniref:rhodanese-like domain-containing protein n=1 Tax=Corynebacterium TaxID=1716 RepID=UPI001EF4BBA6|nr:MULTISPECIES: rhodanese-like domain-containing protein [Corynebacterium]MCG7242581.1 rhodanese-like domain-containing protein [Corynebacterium sp. ACRPS]MCG7270974.1 rhodanese-like domain-containing protein [Corynebacterium sp. ACRQM]MCG7233488.1 rhodanese-like domain-containing protein [Corynebacterium sp. ACRPR]MDK8473226.1 rhodanese-like domain-containing protein [Corynebacterium sp. MSK078]WKS60590.1 rhodanese-like domain-containing protein [Corynebacterium accolens]